MSGAHEGCSQGKSVRDREGSKHSTAATLERVDSEAAVYLPQDFEDTVHARQLKALCRRVGRRMSRQGPGRSPSMGLTHLNAARPREKSSGVPVQLHVHDCTIPDANKLYTDAAGLAAPVRYLHQEACIAKTVLLHESVRVPRRVLDVHRHCVVHAFVGWGARGAAAAAAAAAARSAAAAAAAAAAVLGRLFLVLGVIYKNSSPPLNNPRETYRGKWAQCFRSCSPL